MSMKHKLRRAFRRTAPNVLGSILQDLPELQKTTQPAPVEKKWLPHWFTELAATAAALALLLGVISGAIWFARNNPGDPPLSQFQEDIRVLAQDALSTVCPNGEEPGFKAEIEVTGSADALCRIEIRYKGYNYHFTYHSGVLQSIEFPYCLCVKEGYLSESAVQRMGLLLAEQEMGDTTLYLGGFEQYDSVYHMTFLSKTYFSYTDYYVHAKTGEVLWPSDSMQLEKAALDAALGHINMLWNDLHQLSVKQTDDGTLDCLVTLTAQDTVHELRVSIAGNIIEYSNKPCTTVPGDRDVPYVIGWQKARSIAMDHANLTWYDLIGFEYEFDDETGIPIYTVRLLDANSAEPHTVRINGYTGEITGPVLSRLKARDAALAYLGLDLNDVRSFDVGYSYHDTYAFYVSISTMGASHRLQISSSYAISSCESKTYDTDNQDGPKLDWRQARDAALEHRGFSLDELVSLAVYNKHDHYRVRIMTQHSVDEIFVSVDATTGAIIDQDETLLSEAEAQALAQNWAGGLSTVAQTELVTAEDGQRYYWISLRGQNDDWHLCYYVHAVTGKVTRAPLNVIVPPSPSDGKLDENSAIHIVLEKQYGINWRNRVSLVTCVYDDSVSDDCHYAINFEYDGQFHSVSIHAYSWEILSHTQIPLDHDSTQEHFQTLFGTPGSYYNSALTSLYTSPTELDLYRFFYHTYALDCVVPAINFTQEIPVLDRLKQILLLPDHTIDRVLTNHFGIAMQDLSPEALENLGYISLIDFYYVASEGRIVTENFQIKRMETAEDGTVQLYYTCRNYAYTCVVTLKPTDSGYIILSNLPA